MGKLVSVITPVYNGERFIDAYMESVLKQTYKDIELIIVNDGSTDLTEKKILSYESVLKKRGIIFKYIHKENGGQPSALNEGFKIFTGEYLTWPDCDDEMHKDYIEKKVSYLQQHPEVDYVVSHSAVIDIKNPDKIVRYTWDVPPVSNEDMLYRIINNVNYCYEPGNFFATAKIFKKSIPSLHIYDGCGKWSGPQIQIMLPIIYNGNFGYLDECLFDYYIHENNDHSKYKLKEELVIKYMEGRKVWIETINALEAPDEKKREFLKLANIRVTHVEMKSAFEHLDYEWYKEALDKLDKEIITSKEKIKCYILKHIFLKKIYCFIKRIKINIVK